MDNNIKTRIELPVKIMKVTSRRDVASVMDNSKPEEQIAVTTFFDVNGRN